MEALLKYVVGALLAGGVGLWALKWLVGFAAEKWVKPYIEKLGEQGKKNAANLAAIANTLCTIMVARFPDAKWDDIVAAIVAEFMDKSGITDIEIAYRVVNAALIDSGKNVKVSSTDSGLKTPETIKLRRLYPNNLATKIIDERNTDR